MNREERFEAEILPHLRSLFGAAYRMTGNAHDAEDLVQETFLRAHRAFDRYLPGSNARAWLHTILQRVRTDAFRRTKRRPETVELLGEGPASPPSQDALASGHEDLERALRALPGLQHLRIERNQQLRCIRRRRLPRRDRCRRSRQR